MPNANQRQVLLNRRNVVYLLRDQFVVGQVAPLTNPRICEPGPGTLTITDTNNRMSVAAGVLNVNGATALNDGIASPAAFARQVGRTLLFSIPSITTIPQNFRIGWADTALSASDITTGVDYNSLSTSIRVKTGVTVIDTLTVAGAQHDWAMVMRATGGFLFLRTGGGTGVYTLLWVYNTNTAAQFAKWWMSNATVVVTMDDFRVIDLGGSFATDNGLATALNASPIANDTIVANADAIIEWTSTAATGITQELRVRWTDDSNCWIVRMTHGANTIKLIEKNAGVETERDSQAQTWTNGTQYRVVVVCDTQTIKTYVANVAKNSYTSASFNQTVGGCKVDRAGANLISWPRTVALPNV